MGEDEIHEALSWFAAIDPEVVFHEPMNPKGANFQMCLEAAKKAGYDDVADELVRIRKRGNWASYVVDHIELVQEVAERFEGLQIQGWPDDQLVRETSGMMSRELKKIKKPFRQKPSIQRCSEPISPFSVNAR